MASYDTPIPLTDIESVLAWVDTFKLSRPTKKINRDFSDAVLLAEILNVHYPKLVEMHNYPPRNSHAMKLNNWMTLNRKVLKKLKLTLCCNTMEQLANCAPGVIERVMVMVRDKIRRDEEANKTSKDDNQNMSSGGSYYECGGDDEHVLVVPVKTRINGVLETIQQKVISHESYLHLKEELKDAKESTDVLKQKVEHLDSLLKLKEERIEELQKQLERKATRRKDVEAYQNSLSVPFDTSVPPSPKASDSLLPVPTKVPSVKSIETVKVAKSVEEFSKIPILKSPDLERLTSQTSDSSDDNIDTRVGFTSSLTGLCKVEIIDDANIEVDRIKSDLFREAEPFDDRKVVEVHNALIDNAPQLVTIDQSINNELHEITNQIKENNSYL